MQLTTTPPSRCTWIILTFVSWICFVLNLRKIHLFTADLGRHIANGRELLKSFDVLTSNYYSYTFPDFPFVNHHWASGLLFHLIHSIWGFEALSLLHSGIITFAFLCMGHIVCRQTTSLASILICGLCLPLVVARTEVRPESFSYLFVALFYLLLWHWRYRALASRWLWILPIGMMLWINLHIYFFFGFILFVAFAIDKLQNSRHNRKNFIDEVRFLGLIAIAMFLASLINPLGWQIVIYPFRIFDNYGYMIAENQSILFFWRHPMPITEFVPYHALAFMLVIGTVLTAFYRTKHCQFAPLFLGFLGGVLGFFAIRNFTIFGLLAMPALANIFTYSGHRKAYQYLIGSAGLALSVAFLSYGERITPRLKGGFGAGLLPETDKGVRFFREQGLKGPILNNYDIGSYLIFYLFPEERVFVDNRPEAYPRRFFENVYIPLQESDAVFVRETTHYGFNTIFFYRHDNTPAGQRFLISRIQDETWVPVFVDDNLLIMVRNAPQNAAIIEKFALPKSMFRISS